MGIRKNYRKLMFRNLRGSLNRFLSILAITALGAGFLAGIISTTPDMKDTVSDYFERMRVYDIDIKGSAGITDSDVEAVRTYSGVEDAVGIKTVDSSVKDEEGNSYVARIYESDMSDAVYGEGENSSIGMVELSEGRLPSSAGECLIADCNSYVSNHEIGDIITVDNNDLLAVKEFTVVGIMKNPIAMSIKGEPSTVGTGTVSLYIMAGDGTIDTEFFTDIYVLAEGAYDFDIFGDEYADLIDNLTSSLEGLADIRSEERYNELYSDARTELDLAWSEYNSNYNDAKTELDKNFSDMFESMYGQYVQLYGAIPDYTESEEYQGALSELDDSFADARQELEKSEAELSELEMPRWYFGDRFSNTGYTTFSGDVEKVEALSKVFPVFFYLVAALVSLTTMTRLVEEKRGEIGILRSLGYSMSAVMIYYILYAALASLAGGILGVAIGFKIFPTVIGNAYRMMYNIPAINAVFRPVYAFVIVALSVAIVVLTTFFACRDTLAERPSALMLPKAPKAGKRVWLEHIGIVWKRMKFTQKITARNLFRYKKRLFMTVAGVAGCCALLVTGFGIKDSIGDIVDKQYGDIYRYDLSVTLDVSDPDEEFVSLMNDTGIIEKWGYFNMETGTVMSHNEKSGSVNIVVPKEDCNIYDFINIRERKSGEAIKLDDGIVLTEKLCETLEISAGDTITLISEKGEEAVIRVSAVAENYVGAYAYINSDIYRNLFGDYSCKTVLAVSGDIDLEEKDAFSSALLENSSVSYLTFSDYVRDNFSNSVKSIDYIVVVLIIASGALAVIVLYNLISVNICERRKELATIKVLGFYNHETALYIYREIMILCILGTIAGFIAGMFLHSFVIHTVEVNDLMFGRTVKPFSYLISGVMTLGFSAVVDLIMLPKLKKIDMVESMKAND